MTKSQALASLEAEQLKADHRRSTRRAYARAVSEYCDMLSTRTVTDFQGYLDHLAVTRQVSWKTIPFARTA